MAQQSLDKERKLPWEVLAQLGPAVTGAVFFSKSEAMKMIEEAMLDYAERGGASKSFVGQGGTSLALRLPTGHVAKWLPLYNPLSQISSVAAHSRWKDLYERKGLPDPATFLLPTQAIPSIRGKRKGWWIIQPMAEHPHTLLETDPARLRGKKEFGTPPKPGQWMQDVRFFPSPFSEEVRDLERQIREHPVLGKKDPSGAPRFGLTDVDYSGGMGWQNVGLDPKTKKPVLYDLGTLINLEAKPFDSSGGDVRRVPRGFPSYTLKQRRLPSTFKKGAAGGAAGVGISLLMGAVSNLVGGGE